MKGGTRVTIEELIDRHGDGILRLCLIYLGDRQLAEDAFQETFLRAWRCLPDFREESSHKTWLTRIALNTCRSMLRTGWFRLWRRTQDVDELLNLAAPEEAASLDLTRELCALPGLYREVIIMHYYENLTTREIAEVLHVPAGTVSTRLRAAKKRLRTRPCSGPAAVWPAPSVWRSLAMAGSCSVKASA